MLSNSIIDMRGSDFFNVLFLATGKGLSRFNVTDSIWTSYTTADSLGKGGVTALDVREEMIFLATAFDTLTSQGHYTAGGGIAWSANPDTGWAWMPQPVDSPEDTVGGASPTTTNIQNITYDIAITDTAVWIASYAGGLRKYSFADSAWHNIPPDYEPFSALDNYNHRVFSVIAADSFLFVGTANGINKSPDGGNTWVNYNHLNSGISGDFVTALAHQHTDTKDIIWAATWPTDVDQANQTRSVSKSENWGSTWVHCTGMDNQFTHNFAFDDSIVYAADDDGLWKSIDYGETWYLIPPIVGQNSYAIYQPETYCADVFAGRLWVGTVDGLASTEDYGNTWSVYRAFVSTSIPDEPSTYAYPNPYSPLRWNYVRFQYHLVSPAEVTVKIYDFALDHVVSLPSQYKTAGDWSIIWDGRNSRGDIVANGVYFYKLDKAAQGTAWGKIMILD